jgi:transposase
LHDLAREVAKASSMAAAAKKKRKSKRPTVEVDVKELDKIVDASLEQPLTEEEAGKLRAAIHAMAEHILAERRSSEKLDKIIDEVADKDPDGKPKTEKLPTPGHGKLGADAYTGAERVTIAHSELKPGCQCPECLKGKLSEKKPRTLVRVKGFAPISATVYELQRLRCNLCGEVFTAKAPPEIGEDKYGVSVTSTIALLKFGYGIPYDRLERLQKSVGIPMPASTQYELLEDGAIVVKPVHQEMLRQAAQAAVIHTDDTSMKILKVERDPEDSRTGLFTSGIVAVAENHKVGLFFTGPQHAGENLRDVLFHRAQELEAPVLMCDALSWNASKLKAPGAIALAHCIPHGRRKFVEVAPNFPNECLHVLTEIAKVFHHDQVTREARMAPAERLKYHKQHSSPVMNALAAWIDEQLDGKVEPVSGLGKALKYLKKNWKPLTLFLRDGRAPLDNNICERAIKKAVLNRKNAMFYRTLNGAQVGDLYMSLVHTCELNGVNPFDYLNALQEQEPEELKDHAAEWMPWNYKARLEALAKVPPAEN